MKKIHVIKRGNRWAVRREKGKRASKVFDTKGEAVVFAQNMEANRFHVIVHDERGRVEAQVKQS